jgi:hypothetical protein
MKSKRLVLVVLLGEIFGGCNPPQSSRSAIRPSNCELAAIPDAGYWGFSEKVNVMDGSKTSIASLPEKLIIRCRGGDLRRDLICKGGNLDAYVMTDEIVDDESPSVRIRFDDSQPVRQTWSRSTDYKAMFAPNPRQFVAALSKSKEFFIEYPPYQKMPETLHIHTEGLAESVDALDMDSFLRGLTRENVVEACGPGIEENRGTVRFDLTYLASSDRNTGVKFEFSTYGDDAGKIVSIETVGGKQAAEPALKWYGSTIGDSYDQMKALRIINSSPGLLALWKKSRRTIPRQKSERDR